MATDVASKIPISARAMAAKGLARVIGSGESLSAVLAEMPFQLAGSERAFAQELCYGSLRWHGRLQPLLAQLLAGPLKKQEQVVGCLLLLGLYQLIYLG